MPSEGYHLDRYHAHKKWMKYHRMIAGFSAMTIVGLLWAWASAIKGYQHYKQAKKHESHVHGPVD